MLLVRLFSACASEPVLAVTDTPVLSTPVDGRLPEGEWGSEGLQLDVDARGRAVLARPCWTAELGDIRAVDGTLDLEFEWHCNQEGLWDSGSDYGQPGRLQGTVSTTLIEGTMLNVSGDDEEVRLVFGVERTPGQECP